MASMTRRGPARDRVAGSWPRRCRRSCAATSRVGFEVGAGAGDGGRVDRVAAELLSPDRAAAEGAALGQLACALPGGGLLITASRLVEFGARAAILLAPGPVPARSHAARGDARPLPARAVRVGGRVARRRGVLGRLPRPEGPGPDRAARAVRRPGRPAAGLDPRALVHRARRAGHALRGQVRDHMDVDALLSWYERVRRPLPWRETRDPYALLVSEVMLQQTQALRVVPYYERWLARFPDAAALARAPVRDVLVAVERAGLQPARARAAARGGGGRPSAAGPPISPSCPASGRTRRPRSARSRGTARSRRSTRTCGACCRGATASTTRRARLPRAPASCSRRGRAAIFNQAMMELGATVCRPRAPRCGECPGGRRVRRAAANRRAGAPQPRFEDTDRWARGRVARRAAGRRGAAGPRRAARACARRSRARRAGRPRPGWTLAAALNRRPISPRVLS